MRPLRFVLIFALALISVVAVVTGGLFVYEPSPAQGFAFSSVGATLRLPDGRALAYLEVGDPEGRPVFYFHGGPGSRLEARLFDDLCKELGVRLIAADRPGYGLSDDQKDRTYLDWPGDVAALADHLGIERFAVLGWSSGGPYAAAVAYEIPERLSVAAIVAGVGPIAAADFPPSALGEETFGGSATNRLFIWSARNGPWLMRALFRAMRIMVFTDPAGLVENADETSFSERDLEFFARREFSVSTVEAFRQGVAGATRDFTIERRLWPFALGQINAPTVLVFHGGQDMGVHPSVAEYVCRRMPRCDEPKIFAEEGHSVIYSRFSDIVRAMVTAWDS